MTPSPGLINPFDTGGAVPNENGREDEEAIETTTLSIKYHSEGRRFGLFEPEKRDKIPAKVVRRADNSFIRK